MPGFSSEKQSNADYDVVIVGGGLAGLYSIYRLRKLGLTIRDYEAGDGVGGTWFWNRYPGARCDVPSLQYSYAFDEELQQDWKWPERYSAQGDILKYIQHVADRFDLMQDVQLSTRVRKATYDDVSKKWLIDIDNKSGAGLTFLLLGALVCSLGLLLQLLIWVINLFMGGINFLTWGLKFHMPRTQGKRIKNQGKLKE